MPERMMQLALSQKAGKLLIRYICRSIDTVDMDLTESEDTILAAIVQDLEDQIEEPKKKKSKKSAKH